MASGGHFYEVASFSCLLPDTSTRTSCSQNPTVGSPHTVAPSIGEDAVGVSPETFLLLLLQLSDLCHRPTGAPGAFFARIAASSVHVCRIVRWSASFLPAPPVHAPPAQRPHRCHRDVHVDAQLQPPRQRRQVVHATGVADALGGCQGGVR
jgi:hypothetical protein